MEQCQKGCDTYKGKLPNRSQSITRKRILAACALWKHQVQRYLEQEDRQHSWSQALELLHGFHRGEKHIVQLEETY